MEILTLYTSQIDMTLEQKIMNCFNASFDESKLNGYFQWKYRDNPFGDSLHIIVLDDEKVISTRVFWRLDIDGVESYQCVDTSVLPEYQGKGLFGKTVKAALEVIGDKQIYNYPNSNSAPAYLKYGWKVFEESDCIKLNFSMFMIKNVQEIDWTREQLDWRFKKCVIAKYFQYFIHGKYYIFGLRRNRWPVLLGYVKCNLHLENIKPVFSFSYDRGIKGICIRKKLVYMYKYKEELDLKSYLFDMI